MGKNKNKGNKKPQTVKQDVSNSQEIEVKNEVLSSTAKKLPTVSIVTITQYKRFDCLKVLRDLIKDQTYKNIIEWVVVEGSKTEDLAKMNAENVRQQLKNDLQLDLELVYVGWQGETKLGELRNRGNKTCKGDITVCMDDDDYYPPERVEYAVEKLSKSTAKIAGCSAVMIYDYFLHRLYKF